MSTAFSVPEADNNRRRVGAYTPSSRSEASSSPGADSPPLPAAMRMTDSGVARQEIDLTEKAAYPGLNGHSYSNGTTASMGWKDGSLESLERGTQDGNGESATKDKPTKTKLSSALIIPIWIALSSGIIVYNKWLYTSAGFPYPIFITSFHLGAAALGTRILRWTTPLMKGLDEVEMTRERYLKSILPIAVLFSGSLIGSNTALSVSFIQMLKAFTPVAILLISSALGIQTLNPRLIGIVCFEASRLVMIQILLQGLKMDPLVSLHYYAPICSAINACFIPFFEGWAPFLALPRMGFFVMFTNAMNAFLLNVSAVYLVGAGGGLVLTLAGVLKDILLVSSSTLFFGSPITPLQIFGYGLALMGLVIFKTAGAKGH